MLSWPKDRCATPFLFGQAHKMSDLQKNVRFKAGDSTNPFELRNKNEEFCVRPWVFLMASGMA